MLCRGELLTPPTGRGDIGDFVEKLSYAARTDDTHGCEGLVCRVIVCGGVILECSV